MCIRDRPEENKKELIFQWLTTNKVEPESFHFVDDQVDTLCKVKTLGVHCALAIWGYNNEKQILKAATAGIAPITLDEALESWKSKIIKQI
jgi:hypothetical protein